MTAVYPVLAAVAAYLLGSLSFAVIVTRAMGLSDPRTYGSKNPGATNVLRSGSKAAAIITLLLDAVKGWLPVALVMWFGHPYGLEDGTVALVGLAAQGEHPAADGRQGVAPGQQEGQAGCRGGRAVWQGAQVARNRGLIARQAGWASE